jgi:hypothetical protein
MLQSIKRIVVKFALRVLKTEVLDEIKYEPVQAVVASTHVRLTKVADIVLDNEPNNKAQFEVFWKQEKKPLALDAITTAQNVLNTEIKDERVRGYLSDLLDEIRNAIMEPGNAAVG